MLRENETGFTNLSDFLVSYKNLTLTRVTFLLPELFSPANLCDHVSLNSCWCVQTL